MASITSEIPKETSLLRFSTAGSVDDGKSTLIGRLLVDTHQVLSDQMTHVEQASKRRGFSRTELGLLTDGLRAEREQGITIDVAYRYFHTPTRKFIVADTPGHVQYTRNMVTGASTSDAAVILVDARHGLTEQSRRHAFVSAQLGIRQLLFCINKMDLVEYGEARFRELERDVEQAVVALDVSGAIVIPISALHGDNVVTRSQNLAWYQGPTLLEALEAVPAESDRRDEAPRFPVQWVIRPGSEEHHDYRGYAGRLASGTLRKGDPIAVWPSGKQTRVLRIELGGVERDVAVAGDSITLHVTENVDIARGDLLTRPDSRPQVGRDLHATLSWFSETSARLGGRYLMKHTTKTTLVRLSEIQGRWDMTSLQLAPGPTPLEMNDLGEVIVQAAQPIHFDSYRADRTTGSFILIDESTNETVAAGLIRERRNVQ